MSRVKATLELRWSRNSFSGSDSPFAGPMDVKLVFVLPGGEERMIGEWRDIPDEETFIRIRDSFLEDLRQNPERIDQSFRLVDQTFSEPEPHVPSRWEKAEAVAKGFGLIIDEALAFSDETLQQMYDDIQEHNPFEPPPPSRGTRRRRMGKPS